MPGSAAASGTRALLLAALLVATFAPNEPSDAAADRDDRAVYAAAEADPIVVFDSPFVAQSSRGSGTLESAAPPQPLGPPPPQDASSTDWSHQRESMEALLNAAPSLGTDVPTHLLRLDDTTRADGLEAVTAAVIATGARVVFRSTVTFPTLHVIADERQSEALRELPAVTRISENRVIPVASTQVRSEAPWNLDRVDQFHLPLDGRYLANRDGSGALTYVVDTGIAYDPAATAPSMSYAPPALEDIFYIDDPSNPSSIDGFDCDGHGTHVAGTLADPQYGIAPGARLVVIKASFDCDFRFFESSLEAAIDLIALDHADRGGGPAVVNLSLGGSAGSGPSGFEERLDFLVEERGIVVVVAAGNAPPGGSAGDACTISPARLSSVITVGASNQLDQRAGFSYFGSCVDVLAPGVAVPSAYPIFPDSGFDVSEFDCDGFLDLCGIFLIELSGTSMAAPLVAGLAALYLEGEPTATPAQVRAALNGGAAPVLSNLSGSPNRLAQTTFLLPHFARFPAPGSSGETVPSTATSVSLSIEVTGAGSEARVVASFPCAQPSETTEALLPSQTVASVLVDVPTESSGEHCLEVRDNGGDSVPVDRMAVRLTGYLAPSGTETFAHRRAVDTRSVSTIPGSLITMNLTQAGITAPPSDVAGLALSVKLFKPTQRALIAVFPCDQPAAVSSADLPANTIGQATVITAVSSTGQVCIQARDGDSNPITAERMIVYTTGWFRTGEVPTSITPVTLSDKD